jgi:hypothetical protein
MDTGQFLFQQLLAISEAQTLYPPKTTFESLVRKSPGGRPVLPAGRAVLPSERDHVIDLITNRRARGDPFSSIAASLNAQGLRGGYGARWYSASVRQYLYRHAKGTIPTGA